MTKTYLLKTDARLHDAVKECQASADGLSKLTLQETFELGMMLLLTEQSKIAFLAQADTLGASPRALLAFKQIWAGEGW